MMDNPTTETATSPADMNGTDWRASIDDPDLARVAQKFDSPAEVLRSYSSLESRLGRSVVKPGRNADETEIAAYRRQLGVPDSPAGYQVAPPEGTGSALTPEESALQNDFLTAMHGAGATPEVVQSAVDWYYRTLGSRVEAQQQATSSTRAQSEQRLAQEWGGDYQRNVTLAQRAVRDFGGEDFAAFLEEAKVDGVALGNHPAFLRTFAQIGRQTAEDTPLSGVGDTARGGLQERIDELHALQERDPQKYSSRPVQAELQALYARLHGTAPIVGTGGRLY